MAPKQALEALWAASVTDVPLVKRERRDWAVRVLDAWAALNDGGHETRQRTAELESGTVTVWTVDLYPKPNAASGVGYVPTPDAARLAAAKAVFPTLPEAVRAELGECP